MPIPSQPPTIPELSTATPTRKNRNTFSPLMDSFVTWFVSIMAQIAALATWFNTTATGVASDAQLAKDSSDYAVAAAAQVFISTNALAFNPATNYAQYATAFSLADPELKTYRRRTAGTSATDPYLDPTNWACISGLDLAQAHTFALYY